VSLGDWAQHDPEVGQGESELHGASSSDGVSGMATPGGKALSGGRERCRGFCGGLCAPIPADAAAMFVSGRVAYVGGEANHLR
jgi:hypothetical protein